MDIIANFFFVYNFIGKCDESIVLEIKKNGKILLKRSVFLHEK